MLALMRLTIIVPQICGHTWTITVKVTTFDQVPKINGWRV